MNLRAQLSESFDTVAGMDFLFYLLNRIWVWIATTGFGAAALVVLLLLVPRIRRYVIAVVSRRLHGDQEDKKGQKALIGAIVYAIELVAYFVLIINLLETLGISIGAAVVPATIVSAALGFGAQDLVKDLLGGVFIIVEKQYGIGDWVEFHTPSGTVQGEVVNLTLRASTIRTLNGEEVIIPNGDAKMSVNYSSRWSRAVIDIPVPLTSGGSMSELERRTLAAAEDAIDKEDVRGSLRSDLSIQSSTSLNPPTAAGQSWTVNLRMIIDTDPGDQWKVERAVRSAIIDTWWEDYGERVPTALLPSRDQIITHTTSENEVQKKAASGNGETVDTATNEQAWSNNSDRPSGRRLPTEAEVDAVRADDPAGDGRKRAENIAAVAEEYGGAAEGLVADDPEATVVHEAITDETTAYQAEEDASEQKPDALAAPKQKLREVLSAGGRARQSTVVLILLFFLFSALNVMSMEQEEGSDNPSGWLAPSRFVGGDSTTEESTTQVPENQNYTEPTGTETANPNQTNQPGVDGNGNNQQGQTNQPNQPAQPGQTGQPGQPGQTNTQEPQPGQEGNAAPQSGVEPQEDSL